MLIGEPTRFGGAVLHRALMVSCWRRNWATSDTVIATIKLKYCRGIKELNEPVIRSEKAVRNLGGIQAARTRYSAYKFEHYRTRMYLII